MLHAGGRRPNRDLGPCPLEPEVSARPAASAAPVGVPTGMSDDPRSRHTDQHEHHREPTEEGQVSEASSLERAGEPIAPSDSVAGAEPGESGRADEGPTGPDAVTNDDRQDRHPGKGDVETTG